MNAVADEFPGHSEPRWPVILAILAVGGLYTALPPSLTVGPRWIQLAIAGALLAPAIYTQWRGYQRLNRILGHVMGFVLTIFLLWSLALLIRSLPMHKESPSALLRSAAALWVSNMLVFAQWYWRLDAGGPHARARRRFHTEGAFLFPQMTLSLDNNPDDDTPDNKCWSPNFVDYLFLAFNTSTALSPTDAPVLSRWAKGMLMTQSLISLTVVVILAGRAVNIM